MHDHGRSGALLLALTLAAGPTARAAPPNASAPKPRAARQAGPGAAAHLAARRSLVLGDDLALDLVLVPAATFDMGSPADEPGHLPNEAIRRTVITRPYYLGVHEVTQAQYRAVMGSNPTEAPHRFADPRNVGPTLPVVGIGHSEAVAFCEALAKRTGAKVRLPTEAEWENACRAQGPGAYGAGVARAELARYAVFGKPARLSDPVGSKQANALGLRDITGNVWEWTSDWFAPTYDAHDDTDPQGPRQPTGVRVFRGGCSFNNAELQRCAFRHTSDPTYKDAAIGFRVLVEAD